MKTNDEDNKNSEDEFKGFFQRLISGRLRKKKIANAQQTDGNSDDTGMFNFIKRTFRQNKSKSPSSNESGSAAAAYAGQSEQSNKVGCISSKRIRKKAVTVEAPSDGSSTKSGKRCIGSSKARRKSNNISGRRRCRPSTTKTSKESQRKETREKGENEKTAPQILPPEDNERTAKESTKDQRSSKSHKKTETEKTHEENLTESIKAGFTNLKKNFISRPYRSASMQKMLSKLAQRHKRIETGTGASTGDMAAAGTQKPRLAYEDYFPQTSGSSASHQSTDVSSAVRTNSTKSSFTLDPLERTEMEKRIKVLVTAEDDEDFKKKYVPVLTNKTNHGKLFSSNGRPFWQNMADEEEEPTDDELPMNADLIAEVYEGKIQLVDMPEDPVILNPFGPLSEMVRRDERFFTRDIIFSNTVRTMVNLNDEVTDLEKTQQKKTKKKKEMESKQEPTFALPTHVTLYDRENPKINQRMTIAKLRES